MRWTALAPLLAVTGCNWVFGLEPTVVGDAPGSELPPGPRTKLVWAIATTDGMPAPPAVDAELVYKPIGSEPSRPQLPVIQVGDDNGLSDAAYDVSDGSFEIPYRLRESPHRIVYTLPGESVPHEVQWSITGAFLAVPRTTRADAPATPTASGYRITPTGITLPIAVPAIYTSGAFTYDETLAHFDQTNGVAYAYAQHAAPFTAPAGPPQAASSDWVMIGSWGARGAGQRSLIGWTATKVELVANTFATSTPAWVKTPDVTLTSGTCPGPPCIQMPATNVAQLNQRIDTVLGSLGVTDEQYLAYGVSPSAELPGYLPGVAPTFVERPLIMPFAVSATIDPLLTTLDPSASLGLPRVMATRAATSRTVAGAVLMSSVQAITSSLTAGMMQYAAPLAVNISLGSTSLSGPTDGVQLAASSSVQRLKFETESGFDADDFVVTLYELSGGALAPVRIYHVLQPEVKIDGSLLVAGHQYVFGINARTGFGAADRGDYAKAQYPFGSATTFPRTFIVQ